MYISDREIESRFTRSDSSKWELQPPRRVKIEVTEDRSWVVYGSNEDMLKVREEYWKWEKYPTYLPQSWKSALFWAIKRSLSKADENGKGSAEVEPYIPCLPLRLTLTRPVRRFQTDGS